ncbi:hypothetical protein ACQRIT_002999 [Beauveria bassiana]
MLRNRVFTALQKTYDESYLSCSTAVYYESQGDETEALRHWRNALALIYEHNATKVNPGYGPQTDTEKALVDALRELELQFSPRPPLPIRTVSETPQSGERSQTGDATSYTRSNSRPPALSVPPKADRTYRSPSPEKHTMRTTLRSSKLGEKASAPSRKSARPAAEGPKSQTTENASARPDRYHPSRLPAKRHKEERSNGSGTADDSSEWSERRSASEVPVQHKAATRRTDAIVATQSTMYPVQATRHRRRDQPMTRHVSVSSTSEDDADSQNMKLLKNKTPVNHSTSVHSNATLNKLKPSERKVKGDPVKVDSSSEASEETEESIADKLWKKKKSSILRNLPSGVDESAAKQILNEIVVKGDEVRWGDIAGLEIAKNALRETVVYPFLRPDLFMGLREPARGQQKHSLSPSDVQKLVGLTDGFSGSDITALAKDAAMGPLRSLGEALLHMTMDEIRPISLVDFEASLRTIRPSVSKSGLKEYEIWANEFGERGG